MSVRESSSPVRLVLASLALAPLAAAQEPLFTMVQVSDSQPRTTDEYERFDRVLRTISEGGQPGAFLPRRVDFVLFAGDITYGNTHSEWNAATMRLDTFLTDNDIPFLAVPGNHDVNNEDVALYEQYIAQAEPWDVSSEAIVGHNGRTFTSNWAGMRFIGFNNSNPGWNTMTSADLAAVQDLLAAAVAADENVFFLSHHPHDDKDRMPLRDVLPEPLLVGYLRGHTDAQHVSQGLAQIVNPNVWDVGTNAIYKDACLVYFEVFQSELHAYVITLDDNPSSIGIATVIPLVHPLQRAAEPDFGVPGPLHTGSIAAVTARTPERKAWFAEGAWWSILWSPSAAAHRIHRLDTATGAWTDTGPTISGAQERAFDVLVEGGTLLVASNVPTVPATGGNGSPGQLHRLTWDAGTQRYVATAGYPVAVNDARAASLVLARDGAGTLWTAWTQGGAVMVNRTLGSDSTWGTPITLATGLATGDTVALAPVSGQLAALWTNGSDGSASCARHVDGAADTAWTTEVAAPAGTVGGADLDLVTSGGRLLAAVRRAGGGLDLLERSTGGAWSTRELGAATDELAQPLLLVDDSLALLRLVATAPTLAGRATQGGGAIYTKVAPLSTLDFPPGRGTPLIQDGIHPSARHATSTRAHVTAAGGGLTVLASVAEEAQYWHAFDALVALPPAPVADFTANVTSGPAPLVVDFEDLSTGAPTHWSWDFGDGDGSLEQAPRHVFGQPGDYAVTLRASNGFGEDVLVRTAYVSVAPPPSTLTYYALADARVSEGSPNNNYGGDSLLRVRNDSGGSYHSYLRFDLSSLPGTASSAVLRLFCTDGSPAGGSFHAVADDSWAEGNITWNNRPAISATPLAVKGGVTAGFWVEVELGPGAVQPGLVSLAIAGGSSNSVFYASRESSTPPELVVTFAGGGAPPVAAFDGGPLQGPAPLSVSFNDLSSDVPTAWSWDFGDGNFSLERSPTHVYTEPGVYTVVLDVSNGAGFDSLTRLDYVVVEEPPPPPPVSTHLPIADARVTESSTRNFGSESVLRVRQQSNGSSWSFLKFEATSLAGPVVDATLRIRCTDGSPAGGSLYVAPTGWDEDTITWVNRPSLPATPLATLGAVDAGAWYELDVSSVVNAPGTYAFALAGGSSNSAYYSSREGADPAELVIATGEAGPPDADFDATPITGAAPLQVSFTDLSVGSENLLWTFGDGSSSTQRHPVHVYADPGVYTVTLQVSNALGTDSVTRTDLITVTTPPPVRTFHPIADARVNEGSPGSEAGSSDVLRVRESSGGSYHTYLRFDLATLSAPVVSARLRLFCTDGSPDAGNVFPTSGAWTEDDVNWSNAPGATGALVASGGGVVSGEWAEFDVTSALTGPELNLLVRSTSSNSCYYSSREGARPPELVVETATP